MASVQIQPGAQKLPGKQIPFAERKQPFGSVLNDRRLNALTIKTSMIDQMKKDLKSKLLSKGERARQISKWESIIKKVSENAQAGRGELHSHDCIILKHELSKAASWQSDFLSLASHNPHSLVTAAKELKERMGYRNRSELDSEAPDVAKLLRRLRLFEEVGLAKFKSPWKGAPMEEFRELAMLFVARMKEDLGRAPTLDEVRREKGTFYGAARTECPGLMGELVEMGSVSQKRRRYPEELGELRDLAKKEPWNTYLRDLVKGREAAAIPHAGAFELASLSADGAKKDYMNWKGMSADQVVETVLDAMVKAIPPITSLTQLSIRKRSYYDALKRHPGEDLRPKMQAMLSRPEFAKKLNPAAAGFANDDSAFMHNEEEEKSVTTLISPKKKAKPQKKTAAIRGISGAKGALPVFADSEKDKKKIIGRKAKGNRGAAILRLVKGNGRNSMEKAA